MPRRGSKAQLVHLLAIGGRFFDGPDGMEGLDYSQYSHCELKEIVASCGIEPGIRGRPRKDMYVSGSAFYFYDKDLVQKIERAMHQHECGVLPACRLLIEQPRYRGVSADTLRQRYYRAVAKLKRLKRLKRKGKRELGVRPI